MLRKKLALIFLKLPIPCTRVNIIDIMLAFKAAPKLAAAPEVSAANPFDA